MCLLTFSLKSEKIRFLDRAFLICLLTFSLVGRCFLMRFRCFYVYNFLGSPLGHFGHMLGTFGGSIGSLWGPFGSHWVPLGSTLGSLWLSLGPLGTILDDFGIMFGPSECRKGPEGDEERLFYVFVRKFGDIR